ncbi:MAG: hypothetical protein M3Q30_04355 [Actinomycetota bacterium]|nr:hypothetical protein [Actinomycetota bacterium]
MSEITSRIQQYRHGDSDWPTLRDWLVNRHYIEPGRYAGVQKSVADLRLTDTEYREVSRGIDARLDGFGNGAAFLRSVTG